MKKYSIEQLHKMVIGLQDFVPDQVDRLNPYEVLPWAEEDAEAEYHGEQADYYRIENRSIVGLSKEQLYTELEENRELIESLYNEYKEYFNEEV